MKTRKKILALTVCAMVLITGSVLGTMAWLTAETDEVVNTFTYGNINIDLNEHVYDPGQNALGEELTKSAGNYLIIPGIDLPKDPFVTVKAGSEDCYLFVKVEESEGFAEGKVTYAVDESWAKGDGTKIPANVYYRQVSQLADDVSYNVLKDNKIFVSENLTKDEVKEMQQSQVRPTLKFTAYAIQAEGIDSAETAWSQIGA